MTEKKRLALKRALCSLILCALALTPVAGFADTVAQTDASNTASATVKKAPKSRAVQAVYEAQNALFREGLTIKPKFTYTYSGNRILTLNGFLALGAIFLGNINVSQQKNSIYQFDMGLEYGVTPRLKIGVDVPYLVRHSLYIGAGQNQSSSQSSDATVNNADLGDVTANAFYQIIEAHGHWPNVIWNFQVVTPTGKAPYGIPLTHGPNNTSLQYPSELPTGQGVWGISSGFTVVKSVEPAVLFASANYFYEFAHHFSNISSKPTVTVPGDAQPGRAFSIELGTAFSLSRQFSTSLAYSETFTQNTQLRPDGGQWSDVVGSSSNAASFNVGVTYAVTHNFSVIGNVAIGMTSDAPDTQVSLSFPYHF